MSERAQALEAAKAVNGWIDRQTMARDASDYSKGWRVGAQQAVEEFRAALLAGEAPPVGVSPQPVQRFDLVSVNFAYTSDHEMERADDGEWVRFDDVFPLASPSPVEPKPPVHNDLCSWCLTQADHVAASEECYERNSERGRVVPKSPVEPTPSVDKRTTGQHVATCETNGHIYGHAGMCVFCGEPKSAPVEPTPEPPAYIAPSTGGSYGDQFATFCARQCVTRTHCHHHGRCLAECLPDDLKPTGEPAPCVWRPISALHNEEWHRPDCTQALSESIHKVLMWKFCHFCGHPLTVER